MKKNMGWLLGLCVSLFTLMVVGCSNGTNTSAVSGLGCVATVTPDVTGTYLSSLTVSVEDGDSGPDQLSIPLIGTETANPSYTYTAPGDTILLSSINGQTISYTDEATGTSGSCVISSSSLTGTTGVGTVTQNGITITSSYGSTSVPIGVADTLTATYSGGSIQLEFTLLNNTGGVTLVQNGLNTATITSSISTTVDVEVIVPGTGATATLPIIFGTSTTCVYPYTNCGTVGSAITCTLYSSAGTGAISTYPNTQVPFFISTSLGTTETLEITQASTGEQLITSLPIVLPSSGGFDVSWSQAGTYTMTIVAQTTTGLVCNGGAPMTMSVNVLGGQCPTGYVYLNGLCYP